MNRVFLNDPATRAATVAAGAMIANQVAGKATRDALFLSNYAITALPFMVIAASLFAILVVFVASPLLRKFGPHRLMPRAFALSALLLLLEWWLCATVEKVAAVVVFLHMMGLGSFLISGFWSVVNERFDPRSAKKSVSAIAAGATVGGLVGGIVAERVAATASTSAALPALAVLHFVCAWRLSRVSAAEGQFPLPEKDHTFDLAISSSGLRVLAGNRYLRSIGLLVLSSTISAGLIDFVFKAQATRAIAQGEDLLRFFALFHTTVGLLAVLAQTWLSRTFLERIGLARTASTLPGVAAAASLGALAFPGILSATLARGSETVVRNSLFRSGYELLYTPVAKEDKRAAKSLIDVGFERLGDALAGFAVWLTLFFSGAVAHPLILGAAAAVAALGLWISRTLHQGYVAALEKKLIERAPEVDLSSVADPTTRHTLMQTIAVMGIPDAMRLPVQKPDLAKRPKSDHGPQLDPLLQSISDLRSGDAGKVLPLLRRCRPTDFMLTPHIVLLLAWDQVSEQAIQALAQIGPSITGQLTDALVDSDRDFAIRRRVPRVMVQFGDQRSVEGLEKGLSDRRFEVRFQCGRALSKMLQEKPELRVSRDRILNRVLREVDIERKVWESHRLLDQGPDKDDLPFVGDFLRNRTNRSLEHVFVLLSMVLPREPLGIAFRGLHTDDEQLRGTALEYLESVLPREIREKLWPFLEEQPGRRASDKSRDEILESLMKSNQSIQLNLAQLVEGFQRSEGATGPHESDSRQARPGSK